MHCTACKQCDLPQHSCGVRYEIEGLMVVLLYNIGNLSWFLYVVGEQLLGATSVAPWSTRGGTVLRKKLHLQLKDSKRLEEILDTMISLLYYYISYISFFCRKLSSAKSRQKKKQRKTY